MHTQNFGAFRVSLNIINITHKHSSSNRAALSDLWLRVERTAAWSVPFAVFHLTTLWNTKFPLRQ